MTQTLALPSFEDATVVVPRSGRHPRQLVRRRERRARRGRLLADLPGPPAAARGPRRLRGRGPLRGRRALRDRRRGAPRRVRRRVVRAAGAGAATGGRLAALPLLRHAGLQALVDRGGRRRRARGSRARHPHGRPPRLRRGRRQGPGRAGRRDRLADVGLRAPAHRGRPRGPDDHRVRDEHRRSRLGVARHRARADARHLGPARRPGHRSAVRAAARGAVRRTGLRRGQLARGHGGGPLDRRPAPRRRGPAGDPLAAQRRCAALRRGGAAARRRAPASTSRPPGPTVRTT